MRDESTGPMRVIAYTRVSTAEQGRSGLGLAAQREAIEVEASRRGWRVEHVEDAGFTAANLRRPGIAAVLDRLGRGDAGAIVVAKLDRLSRSALDFAALMDRARREGWAIIALDLGLDMTTPAGEMVAGVIAQFAQYERRLIGARIRDALAVKRADGARLGRERMIAPATEARIRELRDDYRLPLRAICAQLERDGIATTGGGAWRPSTLQRVLARDPASRAA